MPANAGDCRRATVAALVRHVAPPRQDYPTQTIKIIIPFGPGGGSDIVGRIVAPAHAGEARPDRS